MTITTQSDLRAEFWRRHPQHKPQGITEHTSAHTKWRPKRQNEYPTDVRVAWVDFVDWCARSHWISNELARRATL